MWHPGWFRPTPTEYDEVLLVAALQNARIAGAKCEVSRITSRTTTFKKTSCRTRSGSCFIVTRPDAAALTAAGYSKPMRVKSWAAAFGREMRTLAVYLRNDIGISYRKVPRALEEMFGFSFVPGSLIA